LPSGGGAPEVITELDTGAGDVLSGLLDVLPGGRGVVFTVQGPNGRRLQVVDVETGEVNDLTPGQFPKYSPTGHLLFLDEDGTLLAAPFDVESLELTGVAVPVVEGVAVLGNGQGFFAVSQTGTLVYRTGSAGGFQTPVWVERDGTPREIDPGWRTPGHPLQSSLALSPNGDRLAISIQDIEGTTDLWVKQLDTGTLSQPLSRLTFEGTRNRRATWSPDGQSLTFLSNRAGDFNVWTRRADGSGTARLVLDQESNIQEGFYSPDGTWLVFREGDWTRGVGDIYAIRPGVDSVAVALTATEFSEYSPALSPNGRWLAYVSDESGREEVYVIPFPEGRLGGLAQVSADGGREPVWAHNGPELFYRNGADELVVVQFTEEPTFTVVGEEVLFSMSDYLTSNGHPMYDVSLDDQRFVMLRFVGNESASTQLIMVTNFFEELQRLVPN